MAPGEETGNLEFPLSGGWTEYTPFSLPRSLVLIPYGEYKAPSPKENKAVAAQTWEDRNSPMGPEPACQHGEKPHSPQEANMLTGHIMRYWGASEEYLGLARVGLIQGVTS